MKKNVLWRVSLASAFAVMTNSALAQGDAAAGEAEARTCLGCHGIPGYQNVYPTYKVPRIAGQNEAYLEAEGLQGRQPRPQDDGRSSR